MESRTNAVFYDTNASFDFRNMLLWIFIFHIDIKIIFDVFKKRLKRIIAVNARYGVACAIIFAKYLIDTTPVRGCDT